VERCRKGPPGTSSTGRALAAPGGSASAASAA